jgi:hypothetical protein
MEAIIHDYKIEKNEHECIIKVTSAVKRYTIENHCFEINKTVITGNGQ